MIKLTQDTINAATSGDLESLTASINSNPELVNARNSKGQTLLHIVASQSAELANATERAQALVKAGADVNAQDDSGQRPLQYALGNIELVRALLDANAETAIYAENHFNMSPAEVSLYHQRADEAALLVERGAPIDLRIEAGLGKVNTMCQHVGQHGGFRYSSIGLPGQPGPKLSINDGLRQALAFAVRNGQIETIKLLVDEGAPVNDIVPHIGNRGTPLHHAVEANQVEAVRVLVENGAKTDIVDQTDKVTPVERAKQLNHTDIVEFFDSLKLV